MAYANRVEDTVAAVAAAGLGAVTLSGLPPALRQGLSALGGVGATFDYSLEQANTWEDGRGTITGSNSFSRAPTGSSSGGAAVAFTAGARFYHDTSAASFAKFNQSDDIASFSTIVPLTARGDFYMPQYAVASLLTFTVAPNPVKNARVYVRLVANANGAHVPIFSGMKRWGGSMDYDNRNGIVNIVMFFYDGYDYWYFITQADGAVAIDATPPAALSALVSNATPTIVTITHSEALDPNYVPAAASYTVGGHAVSAVAVSGSAVNLTCAAFVNGEPARAIAYAQPGANGVRDLAGNLLAGFSNLPISNNVGAVATGATLAGPSGGTVSAASTVITLAIAPIGSNVTGTVRFTFTDGGAGGSFNPAYIDVSNGTPSGATIYTAGATPGALTLTTTNNGGLANPTLGYTTASGALRFSPRDANLVESGTSPNFSYATNDQASPDTNRGTFTKAFQASADGSAAITVSTGGQAGSTGIACWFGVKAGAGLNYLSELLYYFYVHGGQPNYTGANGGIAGASMAGASGDIRRLRRGVNTSNNTATLYAEVARAADPGNFTIVHTWTGVPTGVLYPAAASGNGTISNLTAVGLA